jgi:radical SAM superfamily enzyme YgiQ (UPF0313 family)
MYDIILFGDMPDRNTYSRASGSHRIGTELREHGYSVLVVDFSNYINIDKFSEIIDLAVGENTLGVGFSTTWFPFLLPDGSASNREPSKPAMRFNKAAENLSESLPVDFAGPHVEDYFDKVRSVNPKTKVILGGAKAFMYINLPGIDNVFIGHAETMVVEYFDSLSGKTSNRIWNKIIDHDKKAQRPSWDFRKSNISYEDESFILPSETLLLEVGRGCRFNCKFCSFPLIGQKNIGDYLKFEECLYNELMENWNRFGTWKYTIVDDTFNDSTEKLEMVKRVVDRLPFKPAFWCYLRLDIIVNNREHIQLAKDIGIREVYFGIETLNREAGKAIGKGMDPKRITETLEECARVWGRDTWIQTGLICGLPKDNVADFEKSCEYFNRPDRPVGHVNTTPLRIIKHTEYTKHRFNAAFELESAKYGYEFPYDDVLWRWIKKDGTDIDTYEKACNLAIKWQTQLDTHIEFRREFFYLSCINDPKYDYNTLMNIKTKEEFYNYIGDQQELMHTQILEDYFKPLMKFLYSRKREQELSRQPSIKSSVPAF